MNKNRLNIIEKAFEKLDKSGDGVVTIDDLKGSYDVRSHPEYQNGSKTETQLLNEFLRKFEEGGSIDGKVKNSLLAKLNFINNFLFVQITKDEFLDYYSGVSASVDEDLYFDLMMRQAWKL